MTDLQQKIQRILRKFPPDSGKCSQCAAQVHHLLLEAGIKVDIVRIETDFPFLATRKGIQLARRIGNNLAYHEFVQAGDQIFDALTGPTGM